MGDKGAKKTPTETPRRAAKTPTGLQSFGRTTKRLCWRECLRKLGYLAMNRFVSHRLIRVGERLHAPIVNYLILQSAIITASEAIKGVWHPSGPRKEGATITTISYVSNMQFEMPLYGPLEDALDRKKPVDFSIEFSPNSISRENVKDVVRLPSFYDPMIAPIFVLHFEACRLWLNQNGHSNTTQWPMVLDFARHVRNAMAHGGRLTILPSSKGNAPRPVVWHNLKYSISDNERRILSTDLYGPDLIALMADVDDETVALGAPR